MIEGLQSAYNVGDSTETALLNVYNDMVLSIDDVHNSILVKVDSV